MPTPHRRLPMLVPARHSSTATTFARGRESGQPRSYEKVVGLQQQLGNIEDRDGRIDARKFDPAVALDLARHGHHRLEGRKTKAREIDSIPIHTRTEPQLEIRDGVLPKDAGEIENVGSAAAENNLVACAAPDPIATSATLDLLQPTHFKARQIENVRDVMHPQNIEPLAQIDTIDRNQIIRTAREKKDIVTFRTQDRIEALTTVVEVEPGISCKDEGVVAQPPEEAVVVPPRRR